MITLKSYITTYNLLCFILCIILFIYLCLQYQRFKYNRPGPFDTVEIYQKYLDRFYITNMFYTLSCVISYIVVHIIILLEFRYFLLRTSTALFKVDDKIDSSMLLELILFLVLLIISFIV